MRALFIGNYPNPADPYRSAFFQTLIHQFAEMGVDCTVISAVSLTKYGRKINAIPQHLEEVLPSGKKISVHYPRFVSFSAKKIGPLNTYYLSHHSQQAAILRYFAQMDCKFDFVYGHFLLGGGLVAAKIARTYGIPAYVAYGECSYESEVSNRYRELYAEDLEGIRGIISVSTKNTEELRMHDCANGIPILLALNSVDKNIFFPKDKDASREKLGMPKDAFILGYVGYFIERKGCNRLMAACEELDDVKLAFAGKGPLTPQGENVVFCRGLKHAEVADFLGAVDVFVLPTLHEGCCNAVVEAMSCGKPVISSDLPFNYDVLHSGNSIMVDPTNVDQIREAVLRLRDDEALRRAMADQALQDAKELTIDQRAEKILNFIQTTMQ